MSSVSDTMTVTRIILAATAASVTVAINLMVASRTGPVAATAAPTCTAGDLQTHVSYQCDMAPGMGVTPGHQCTWYWTGNRYEVRSGCRY